MVASGIATSIVSAAVLEGNLILGLSNGSIIDCSLYIYVLPVGLTGDQGPTGCCIGEPVSLDGNEHSHVGGEASVRPLAVTVPFDVFLPRWEIDLLETELANGAPSSTLISAQWQGLCPLRTSWALVGPIRRRSALQHIGQPMSWRDYLTASNLTGRITAPGLGVCSRGQQDHH